LSIFNPHGPTLTLTGRDGAAHVVEYRWKKPVALLINGGTRSGKEVLAYGFKKSGYGEAIGERTAGALLAGTAFLLSDGSLLILAVDDAEVDGERIEGKGVAPTIEVPFDIRYAAGKDPQLDKAIEMVAARGELDLTSECSSPLEVTTVMFPAAFSSIVGVRHGRNWHLTPTSIFGRCGLPRRSRRDHERSSVSRQTEASAVSDGP
jgi:hypothetical protein